MARSASECLDDELIMELVQGRLPDDDLLAAEEHMASCADCRLVVAEAAAADQASETTAPTRPVGLPPEAFDPAGPSLAPGARVGRYQIQELIGVGAIGAVYAARDPELHRMVALKVLRTGAAAAGDLRARLLREARAMAQLSHPNVVIVHDAGTYPDGVFLAMELVDGVTLRSWLARAARGLDDIVRVFRAAGEGLAAAHRSGLVHRDFKPENVLCGEDGRVRVTDFGLARPTGGDQTGPHGAIASRDSWVHTVVTRTGILAGTPAYMSPEQFTGEAPDPRSDQFSFCVALYEAIHGERPFAGRTLEEVAEAIVHGRVTPPPAGARVPAALHTAMMRGLSVRREDRHASMEALLGELALAGEVVAPTRRRGRRGRVIAAVSGLAAGAAALTAVLVARAGDEPAAAPPTIEIGVERPSEAPAPAPAASSSVAAGATEVAAEETPTETPPPAQVEAPSSLEPSKASARRPRSPRASRRADTASEEAPDRDAPSRPVRVGDGLRDPFGGGGGP